MFLKTLLHFQIVQVCRLWDDFDANGFSLPTLASLLDDRDVLLLVEQGFRLKLAKPEPDNRSNISRLLNLPEPEEEGEREAPSPDISKKMATFKGALASIHQRAQSPELERMRNHRNKNIAHPVYRTRAEHQRVISKAGSGDMRAIIDTTVEVMPILEAAFLPLATDYAALRTQARADAGALFSRVFFLAPDK
jgi:hypothetical protein